MCMEDIAIGRSLDSQFRQILTDGATPVRIMAPNTRRVSFTVSSNRVSPCFIFPFATSPNALSGLTLTDGMPMWSFTLENIGSMMYQEWFVTDGGVVSVISIIENILEARTPTQLRK